MCFATNKSHLVISSSNRSKGTNTNFSYNVKTTMHYNSLRINYISIPMALYNVKTDINDEFIFNEGGAALTATISPGNYSKTSFASALQSALNAAGADNYTVSVENDDTYNITLSSDGTFQIEFSQFSDQALRLYSETGADTSTVASYSLGVMMLGLPKVIHLLSNINGYNQNEAYGREDVGILVSVPVAPYTTGDVLTYTDKQNDHFTHINPRTISNIHFKMVDEFNDSIDIVDDIPWEIGLEYW